MSEATPFKPGFCVVSVPATSANLGVGFDTLGLAIKLRAQFGFLRSKKFEITGCEERFRGSDNLVWTSYLTALAALSVEPIPVRIDIQSPIPLSGGLGSSSCCVVAGVLGAQAMAGVPYNPEFTLDVATQIEGHPDNVAPAILGGLVSSFIQDGDTVSIRNEVASNIRFVTIAPPYEVRTADARRVLPDQVSRETCIWQMGRCVATVHALEQGDTLLLGQAAHDKLHEPYRAQLIPDFDPLKRLALNSGAAAFVISGSGSTMLAICDDDKNALNVLSALSQARPNFWIENLSAEPEGARIEKLA